MGGYVESTGNKPDPALLVPIDSIPTYLASSSLAEAHKVRIAGRLLHYDAHTGYMLIASDSSTTAVWVDPSVPFEGTTAGIIQRDEGLRSVWMITGSLMHTTPSNLPRTPRDSLLKSTAKKLQKALPVFLAAVLVLHTPTLNLSEWEEVAATRMKAGLLTREKKRRLALEETERNKEEDAQSILNYR